MIKLAEKIEGFKIDVIVWKFLESPVYRLKVSASFKIDVIVWK